MPSPPPSGDPIETRLLIVAEMLDRAVTEVRRVMAEIKADPPNDKPQGAPDE